MRVQLLVTCLVDTFFPDTGEAVVRVLERAGCQVACPAGQTCCGQPAHNAGFSRDARAMAAHTVDVFSATRDPVVVPSGSCAEMIVHHYPALLAGDPARAERAAALARRTFELTQFLVDTCGAPPLGSPATGRVAYHASCHGLRGLGIHRQPLHLLDQVEGLERVELREADTCCGFGGLFSVKVPSVSGAMLDRKLTCLAESGADVVATTDVSCLMHMMGAQRRRGAGPVVRHIADLLDPDPPRGRRP
jgi:L-lactate dehydrogenase complex protein LldE